MIKAPDFLCIGARKTGTTWLYGFLKKHPECYVPRIKEMNFFNSVLFRAEPGTAPLEALEKKWAEIRPKKNLPADAPIPEVWFKNPLRWYLNTYKHPKDMVSGDISPLYQQIPADQIQAIHSAIPQAKILYILRHPYERVVSDFSMFANNRKIDVNEMSDDECLGLLRDQYKSSIRYVDVVNRWSKFFPMSILYYDDLRKDPVSFASQVCGVLGIQDMPDLADETENPNPSTTYGPRPQLSPGVRQGLAAMLLPEARAAHEAFDNDYTAAWLADIENIIEA